jgi:soluble lytic murein transglycosylase-like protein
MGADYAGALVSTAKHIELSPALVACVVLQESGGDPAAVRYEGGFFLRYIEWRGRTGLPGHVPAAGCSLATEKRLRAFSFGLMQVMGETARERGFRGVFLTELLDAAVNLEVGCEYLRHLVKQTGNVERALLRYNGGGNKAYAKEVLDRMSRGEHARIIGP